MLTHASENHGLSALGAGFSQDLAKGIHQSFPSAYPKHEERVFYPARPEFIGDLDFLIKPLKLKFLSLL